MEEMLKKAGVGRSKEFVRTQAYVTFHNVLVFSVGSC
jgi:hypothetical protein